MPDKNRLNNQIPEVKKDEKSGLVTILTDIHRTEFHADNYKDGYELIIDYPHEQGKSDKVIQYRLAIDDFKRKYWIEVRTMFWIPHKKHSFGGSWQEIKESVNSTP